MTGVTYSWNNEAISYFTASADNLYAGPEATEEETMKLRAQARERVGRKIQW
ncbi:MAG: hypothetical protein U5L72_01635 [Bacteroidales bacterium]|nr:hypothetical protein [Bacteroidales bacterium]